MLIESLLERFSFDNCGRRLKGIIKAVFWINTILVAVGWAILSLTMIFNEPEVGFLVLLLGWIPAVFEILFFYSPDPSSPMTVSPAAPPAEDCGRRACRGA